MSLHVTIVLNYSDNGCGIDHSITLVNALCLVTMVLSNALLFTGMFIVLHTYVNTYTILYWVIKVVALIRGGGRQSIQGAK